MSSEMSTVNEAMRDVLVARAEKAEADILTWRKAFQSVTPGGSEYMDPQTCVAFVRQVRESNFELIKSQARRIHELEAEITRLQSSLATARDEATLEEIDEIDDDAVNYVTAHIEVSHGIWKKHTGLLLPQDAAAIFNAVLKSRRFPQGEET